MGVSPWQHSLGFTLVLMQHLENPEPTCLCFYDLRRQEDQELLFRHRLRLVLKQPPKNRDARQVWNPLHVVVLRVNKHAAYDHSFPISNIYLRCRFPPIDTRAGRVTSRTNRIPCGPDPHHDELAGFLRIPGRNLWRNIQFKIGIHEGGLSTL